MFTPHIFVVGFLLGAAVGCAEEPAAPAPPPPAGRDATKIYADFCAACHGDNLHGGKGPSLLTEKSKYGRDDESLTKMILKGRPAGGMPGFAAALNEAEVIGLIAYIREVSMRVVDPALAKSTDLPVAVQKSEKHSYRLESVAEGLDVPWSFVFLLNGHLLTTERPGRLRLVIDGKLQPEPIEGVPEVVAHDEGGLMSIELDPDFAKNGWIYLSFSDAGEEPAAETTTAMTKIIRARLRDNRLVDHETIFSIPKENYQKGFVGYGCRLLFHGEYLYFTVGDRWLPQDAQDLSKANGKVHRVFRDGRIPPDNPFVGQPDAIGSIWSYGNRNPQGLAVDPRNGAIWETEHGPRGGDELNHILGGANYGWPIVTHGINYDGTPISSLTEKDGLTSPAKHWTPSIAVSPIGFYKGNRFPNWKNNLFLGSLGQQKLLRFEINDRNEITHEEELFKGLGRVRDIQTGPDGLLYLSLELVGRPGRIVRLVPVQN
ncbi:PQQ-dependent sugar dehydrogenase [Oleiharenicola lentus]|uniref:PQQ-dependent sugar dehydrogenase n=1 Tax=Oleiharenicola lentus TaxID=2508720 RepID=UPI003F661591